MVHGKKGFDRLIYACKKVLSRPLTWLFYNTAQSSKSQVTRHSPHPYHMLICTSFEFGSIGETFPGQFHLVARTCKEDGDGQG